MILIKNEVCHATQTRHPHAPRTRSQRSAVDEIAERIRAKGAFAPGGIFNLAKIAGHGRDRRRRDDGEGIGGGLAAAIDAVLSLEDTHIWWNFASTSHPNMILDLAL